MQWFRLGKRMQMAADLKVWGTWTWTWGTVFMAIIFVWIQWSICITSTQDTLSEGEGVLQIVQNYILKVDYRRILKRIVNMIHCKWINHRLPHLIVWVIS